MTINNLFTSSESCQIFFTHVKEPLLLSFVSKAFHHLVSTFGFYSYLGHPSLSRQAWRIEQLLPQGSAQQKIQTLYRSFVQERENVEKMTEIIMGMRSIKIGNTAYNVMYLFYSEEMRRQAQMEDLLKAESASAPFKLKCFSQAASKSVQQLAQLENELEDANLILFYCNIAKVSCASKVLQQLQCEDTPSKAQNIRNWLYSHKNDSLSLTVLSLTDLKISRLPKDIRRFNCINRIKCSAQEWIFLPSEIGQLTCLKRLELSHNKLTSLPPEIGQLIQLNCLDLGKNQLTSLPPEIGRLTSLTYLGLNHNKLTSLPSEIGQLTHLTQLTLYRNQLISLPSEIGQLTNLRCLYLDFNKLAVLPIELNKLTKLSMFSCKNNDFYYEVLSKIEEKISISLASEITIQEFFGEENNTSSISNTVRLKRYEVELLIVQLQMQHLLLVNKLKNRLLPDESVQIQKNHSHVMIDLAHLRYALPCTVEGLEKIEKRLLPYKIRLQELNRLEMYAS